MIKIDSRDAPISNLKLKQTASHLTLKALCEFARGVLLSMLIYIIAIGILANFINTNKMIKVMQIGDPEIKIVRYYLP